MYRALCAPAGSPRGCQRLARCARPESTRAISPCGAPTVSAVHGPVAPRRDKKIRHVPTVKMSSALPEMRYRRPPFRGQGPGKHEGPDKGPVPPGRTEPGLRHAAQRPELIAALRREGDEIQSPPLITLPPGPWLCEQHRASQKERNGMTCEPGRGLIAQTRRPAYCSSRGTTHRLDRPCRSLPRR